MGARPERFRDFLKISDRFHNLTGDFQFWRGFMRNLGLFGIIFVLAVGVTGAADIDTILAEKGDPITGGRAVSGSVLSVESVDDTDPAAVVINLVGENTSADNEYWDRVTVTMPAGWSIVSLNAEEVEPSSFYEFPTMAGTGTNVATWSKSDAPCSGLGFLRSGDTQDEARFIITVDTTGGAAGTVDLSYMIEGDNWGGDPHVVCSTTHACGYDSCYGTGIPTENPTDLRVTIQQPPTPTPVEAIPTTTNTGLFVLIGLVLGAGVLVLMRRS
jgi:hypothetical protein